MARINMIYASAANGVIGRDGTLPWHLPEDMAHFKRMTTGCPVIMGRKTWDSLPLKFRPLPGRTNIVVTRQENLSEKGLQRASSLREALSICEQLGAPEVWVIGGAQIYAEAEPVAHRAIVTEIDRDFEGDAFAPRFGEGWRETARVAHVAASGLPYSFVTLERV
ncbi:MAG: dihydrofolate reductase [Comamonadaceae bacterium]|nr:MAG: dihydrofolate reductase [Comamonadaceae bacterium]